MLKDMAPQKYQDKDRNRPSQTLITKDELQEESPSLATFPWPQPILSTHWMASAHGRNPCLEDMPQQHSYLMELPLQQLCFQNCLCSMRAKHRFPRVVSKNSGPTSAAEVDGTVEASSCDMDVVHPPVPCNPPHPLLSTTSTSTAVAGTVGALKTWMERTTRTWVNTAVLSGRSLTSKQKVQPSQSPHARYEPGSFNPFNPFNLQRGSKPPRTTFRLLWCGLLKNIVKNAELSAPHFVQLGFQISLARRTTITRRKIQRIYVEKLVHTTSSFDGAQANPIIISKRHLTTPAKNLLFFSQLCFKVNGLNGLHLQHAPVGSLHKSHRTLYNGKFNMHNSTCLSLDLHEFSKVPHWRRTAVKELDLVVFAAQNW